MNLDAVDMAGERLIALFDRTDLATVNIGRLGAEVDAITTGLADDERIAAHIMARDALEDRLIAFMARARGLA